MEQIKTITDWEKLLERSGEQPVVLLKHSLTCSISQAAFDKVFAAERDNVFNVPVYVVHVQQAEDVSSRVSQDLSMRHDSPQLLVIKAAHAVYAESHFKIDPQAAAAAL